MITFELDGKQVERGSGENHLASGKSPGREIPHLCYSPQPDYRPDGNCRACMVEIEGERVLAPSCKRTPSVGMKVKSESARAVAAREDGDGASGRRSAGARNLARSGFRNSGTGPRRSRSPRAGSRRRSAGRPMPAIRRCASIWMPASSAACACAPAARCRSTTSSAWPIATTTQDRVRFRRPDGRIDLRRLRRMRAGLPDRRADAVGDAGRERDQRHLPRPQGRLRCAPIAAWAARSPIRSRTKR